MELEDIVKELIGYAAEEEWFEFKDSWYDPTEIGAYISSLSNAAALYEKENGYLIWGVNNETHALTDTSFNHHVDVKGEPLEHFLARQLSPDIIFSFKELILNGKRVEVLIAPAARRIRTSFNGVRYVRIGSSKVNLSRFPKREAELLRILNEGHPTLENTPAFVQNLTFNILFESYSKAGIPLNKETFEANLELRTPEGEYNLLAQLLSDNSHMAIRIVQYAGKDKTSPLYAVRNMGDDSILSSFYKLMTYGDVLNVMQSDERDRFAERSEVPLIDSVSYREAAVNALIHNDWTDGNGPLMLVFNNRIEIVSNGTLTGKQTVSGFFNGISVPRNRKLAEIFLQLHISERSGRGVPVITSVYGRQAFSINDNSIVVTIPYDRIDLTSVRPQNDAVSYITDSFIRDEESVPERAGLNETRKRILDEMRKNPGITMKELSYLLSMSDTAMENNISYLKKYGLVIRSGSRRKGSWKVF